MRMVRVILSLWFATAIASVSFGQNDIHAIQSALDEGRIEEAEKLLPKSPAEADPWLGRIALAQLKAGDREAAKQSLRRIQSSSELSRATQEINQQTTSGGATGADFDSLINLITSTVEPDSWDDVGGPGTVQSFPGGVAVDSKGVITKKTVTKNTRSLDIVREAASERLSKGDVWRSSELRMVSLPRLERELMIRLATGEPASEVMTHLAGLFEIQYLFVFPESNDVVIAGPASSWSVDGNGRAVTSKGKPVLLLDDLVTLLRNAREQGGKFGCSIDPKREALAATKSFLATPTGPLKPRQTQRWVNQIRETLGLQDIRVYGIDSQTHAARVLVEADYHMKLVGMGLEPSVDGLESYLESIDKDSIPQSMDVLRWWFTLRPNSVTQNSTATAFRFSKQAVQLQSENERLSDSGERTNTGRSTERNQTFAHQFTQQFRQLKRDYALYAELENLFRMALVAGVLQRQDVRAKLNWDTNWMTSSLEPAKGLKPTEVASIVNHRVIDRRHVVVGVSGGVTVNVASHMNSVKHENDTARIRSLRAAARATPAEDAWWWD